MKNIIYIFQAVILVCLITTSANAQEGQYPLSSGKTLKGETTTKGTDIPTRYVPPRTPPPGELIKDRKVFWVHGHGGGIGSWDKAAAATQSVQVPPIGNHYPPRKIISHRLDYSGSHNAVSAAGTDIKTQIETIATSQTTAEKARNIVIAHSLGGLVSEYADYLYDQQPDDVRAFYGLVTFGTPNLGAVLSKNAYPFQGSKAQQFANEACTSLAAGPVTEEIENSFLLDLILSGSQTTKLTQQFCDILTEDVVTLLLKGFNTPIAADLYPGSDVVDLLSGYAPEVTRRVAYYGVLDNQDLIWKTYHYLKNGPNADPFFGADNAQQTVTIMNNNRAKYVSKMNHWDDVADDLSDDIWWCWLSPPTCIFLIAERDEALDIRNAYSKGVNWWNSANDKWRILMGDITPMPNPQGSCECTQYNINTHVTSGPFQNYFGFDGHCWNGFQYPIAEYCHWVTTYPLTDVESDGIVQASSAIALAGALKTISLVGDSHFSMVNSPRTKVALFGLWEGDVDPFFQTDKR